MAGKRGPDQQREVTQTRSPPFPSCNRLWAVLQNGAMGLPSHQVPLLQHPRVSCGPQMAEISALEFIIFLETFKFLEFLKILNPSIIMFKH